MSLEHAGMSESRQLQLLAIMIAMDAGHEDA